MYAMPTAENTILHYMRFDLVKKKKNSKGILWGGECIFKEMSAQLAVSKHGFNSDMEVNPTHIASEE